jgi:hypothetical protein
VSCPRKLTTSRLALVSLSLAASLFTSCDETSDPYAKERFLNQISGGAIVGKNSGPQAYVHPGEKVTYEKIKLIQWQVAQQVAAETANDQARIAGQQLGAGLAYASGLADAPPGEIQPVGEAQLQSNQLALTAQKYQERGLVGIPPILPSQATPP